MELARSLKRMIQRVAWACSPQSFRKRCGPIRSSSLFAIFFLLFLVVMITTEVVVMRSGMTQGIRYPGPRRFRSHPSAVFGRMLAASRDGERPLDSTNQTRNSRMERASQESDIRWMPKNMPTRDDWLQPMWKCFRSGACPWQPVIGTSDKFFVYSAYLDDDGHGHDPLLRIVGVARTKRPDRVSCYLGWKNANGTARWQQVAALVRPIREHWNLRFSAVFVLCPLRGVRHPLPTFVSISAPDEKSAQPKPALPLPTATDTVTEFNETYGSWSSWPYGNILPIRKGHYFLADMAEDQSTSGEPSALTPPQHQLSVCVKPFHYEFNRVHQLIEFIELNRLLGVSHFTFYNHTVGRQVDCVLRRYTDEGLVDVLPWHRLDVVSQKEIRTEGIFASLNDCLYRRMFDTELLMFIDFDELIIPRQRFTLTEMMSSLNVSATKTAAYYFRNAFFYLQWPDDASSSHSEPTLPLITLQKTRRNVKLHPHRIRSKYICRPRRVVEVGNHFVWEFRSGAVAYHVPDTVAIMHHYRSCEFGGETCLANPSIEDRTAFKYRDQLVKAVQNRLDQWTEQCTLSK